MLSCVAGNHDPLSIQRLRSAVGEQQAEGCGRHHRHYGRDAHHRGITKTRESLPCTGSCDCAGQRYHKKSKGRSAAALPWCNLSHQQTEHSGFAHRLESRVARVHYSSSRRDRNCCHASERQRRGNLRVHNAGDDSKSFVDEWSEEDREHLGKLSSGEDQPDTRHRHMKVVREVDIKEGAERASYQTPKCNRKKEAEQERVSRIKLFLPSRYHGQSESCGREQSESDNTTGNQQCELHGVSGYRRRQNPP